MNLIYEGYTLGILETDLMVPEHPIPTIFHSLSKIHKWGFPPAMCPIVAGTGSLNENQCMWVDAHLQPLVPSIPGYLRDTQHLLAPIDGRSLQQCEMWISADVSLQPIFG